MNIRWLFVAVRSAITMLAIGGSAVAEDTQKVTFVTVDTNSPGMLIDPRVYGQFSEQFGRGVYEGIWVGEKSRIPNIQGFRRDVVEALKRLNVPTLRWPGGCYADTYHWRDGIGPRSKRPARVSLHYAERDDNSFGTHEFMDFAELIGAEPFLNVNMGSASAKETRDWLEYITATEGALAEERKANGRDKPWPIRVVGAGNEMWQCGGNMRAQYYADELRRYVAFIDPYPRNRFIVASGPLNDDVDWTNALMQNQSWTYPHSDIRIQFFDALSLHHYTYPHGHIMPNLEQGRGGQALGFDERAWALTLRATLRMDDLLRQHSEVMNRFDPDQRIAIVVAEWGASYTPDPGGSIQYQQNSVRDALIAALNFNIFHRHTNRVKMANLSMMVNQLQSIILTDREKMVLTPTYHVFDMYQPFKGANPYPLSIAGDSYRFDGIEMPMVSASAARAKDGKLYLALVNLDPNQTALVSTNLKGSRAVGKIITGPQMDSHNSFDAPETVRPMPFAGESGEAGRLEFRLPSKSVAVVAVVEEDAFSS